MIDYSSWPRKKIHVSSLKLDSQNPRLSGFGTKEPNQSQIIEYMMEHENIQNLAKNIATLGFMPNNEPIVYKEKGKYLVLEGNRRTTACKILCDTDLIAKTPRYKRYKSFAAIANIELIQKLSVIIAPSREAADVLIVNIHTQGSPVEKWDKTKQDRFFFNRFQDGEAIETMSHKFNLPKSAIKDSIARHNFFNEFLYLDMPLEIKEKIEDETKFSVTTAERFYKSKSGRDFLGIEITNEGTIIHKLPKLEYEKRLSVITKELLTNKLNSRTFGDEAQQQSYVKTLSQNSSFNFDIKKDKVYQSEYNIDKDIDKNDDADEEKSTPTDDSKIKTPLSPIATINKLIPPIAQNWKTGTTRIDSIFKELKDCNLNTHFNAAAILFRSYLDMIVYQYLLKNNLLDELKKKEQGRIDNENNIKIQRLSKFLSDKGISEGVSETEISKVLQLKTGVSFSSWVPTLKQMLTFLSEDNRLLSDLKLRQALAAYLKGNDQYLGHHDLNLLVHNEYYIKSKKDLKATWEKLYPILCFIHDN